MPHTLTPAPSRPQLPPVRRPQSEREAAYLSTRLDLEWQRLCRRPEPFAVVISWELLADGAAPLTGLSDLLRRIGFRESSSGHAPRDRTPEPRPAPPDDALFAALVRRARTEPLAARIVLQRLLPGLVGLARAHRERRGDSTAFDDVLAEAWWAITRFEFRGRTDHLASRLLSSARDRAFIRPPRRVCRETLSLPEVLDHAAATHDPPAFDELVATVGEAVRRGCAEEHLELVRGLLRSESLGDYAAELGLCPRSVRYRRDRCATTLRRLVAEASG